MSLGNSHKDLMLMPYSSRLLGRILGLVSASILFLSVFGFSPYGSLMSAIGLVGFEVSLIYLSYRISRIAGKYWFMLIWDVMVALILIVSWLQYPPAILPGLRHLDSLYLKSVPEVPKIDFLSALLTVLVYGVLQTVRAREFGKSSTVS